MPGKAIIRSFFKAYKDCVNIVSLYECPDCNFCCTKDDIYFSFYEYRAINRNHTAKHILKDHAILSKKCVGMPELDEYRFDVKPCPYLDSKCTIYNDRPFVCKIYPISLTKARVDNAVTIDPCPLGINIMLDFFAFMLKEGDDLNEYLPLLKICIDDAPYYKEKDIITSMDIMLEDIPDFLNYLKETPANVRKEKRKEILEMANDKSI